MPRQRINHRSVTYYVFPDGFGEALVQLKEASGLSWAEIARRLGADPKTVRRWHKHRGRPNAHYMVALQDLAESLGLGHLLPTITVRQVPVSPDGPVPD